MPFNTWVNSPARPCTSHIWPQSFFSNSVWRRRAHRRAPTVEDILSRVKIRIRHWRGNFKACSNLLFPRRHVEIRIRENIVSLLLMAINFQDRGCSTTGEALCAKTICPSARCPLLEFYWKVCIYSLTKYVHNMFDIFVPFSKRLQKNLVHSAL
jgi:hypothetical protein